MTFKIERVDPDSLINVKGWKIVRSDGQCLCSFTTRLEAELLLNFFTGGQDAISRHQ